MPSYLVVVWLLAAVTLALFFSTLSYALRDFSRVRLGERPLQAPKG